VEIARLAGDRVKPATSRKISVERCTPRRAAALSIAAIAEPVKTAPSSRRLTRSSLARTRTLNSTAQLDVDDAVHHLTDAEEASMLKGHTCAFRKLRSGERALYLDHLHALSPGDRYLRFHGFTSDETIDQHVARMDLRRTQIIGAFVDGRLHGAAEIVFASLTDRSAAELAVSVEDPYQRSGIGGGLTRRALRIAQNRGARFVWMYCLPENEPMRRIAGSLHGQLKLADATIDARLQLAPATLRSRLQEQLEDGLGAMRLLSQVVLARVA
jgi:GNAT superfamily N-acetyltransferase